MNKYRIRKSIENVQMYHKGELFLKNNLQKINIENGIDWNYKHSTSQSTYQVYLHSLPILNDMVTVGVHKKKKNELRYAKAHILEWLSNGREAEYAWHEHAVSSRILNIIKFQESAQENRLNDDLFQKILIEHCEYLNNEENYKHNNHGLMMDNALITASNFIDDENISNTFIDKSLYRIRTSIYRDLTRQGLHIENSPEYHNLYIVILKQILETVKKYNLSLEKDIINFINAALRVRSDLIKPNHEFPLIGDTGQTMYKSIQKTFNNFIDFEGGLIVLQKEKKNQPNLSRYFTFKSGYISKTHKHYDDLSITFYDNGHDVLVDPGKFAYSKNSDREFIISPQAHSTLHLEDTVYNLIQYGQLNHDNLKLTKYYKTNYFDFAEGINYLYEGAQFKRTCVVTKSNDLVVVDNVVNESGKNVIHSFNVSELAKITKGENNVQIQIDSEIYLLEIMSKDSQISIDIVDGFISKKFNEKIDNKIVQFKNASENSKVIFILKNIKSSTNLVENNENNIKLNIEGHEIDIPM